jgi:hypothetical protein
VRPQENPYTPNAGARPPVLVGRDSELEAFEVLLERLRHGHAEQSMIISGLRGVGKTVLLGAFEARAREHDWTTVEAEITRGTVFGARFSHLVRRALLQIAPRRRWRARARRAASVLRSFQLTISSEGTLTGGIDVEAAEGSADSGYLPDDLTDLVVALGEAAVDHETGVVFILDEIQFLDAPELEALIAALHKTVQRQLPVTLVGAGLPQLPRLAGEAKSYAERLFKFPVIGRLDREDAIRALREPAAARSVEIEPSAAAAVASYTDGYPYFIQEYGKVLWDLTAGPPIRRRDVLRAREAVEAKLDGSFFRVRAERASELELRYLRAMAELGPEPQRARDVAKLLDRSSQQLGPTRSRLIDKGLLYTAGHGLAAFTVPQFDAYLRRAVPL